MARKQAVHRTESQWQEVIFRQASSGLSVKDYCESNAVTLSGFYAARKRLAEKPTEQAPAIGPTQQPLFVELEQTQLDHSLCRAPGEHWAVELQIGNNIVLRVRH